MPPLDDVTRVLCVAAHPDDLDFGAAGTIAGWVDAGLEVTYLLCTRGDQGGFDDTPREDDAEHCARTSSGPPPPRSASPTSGSSTATATAGSNPPTSCSATSSG